MSSTPNSIITAQVPYEVSGSLAAATACATRAPTATASLAGNNIFILVPTSNNGRRIDSVSVKGCSSSITAATANQTVTLWEHDGTTAYPFKEILVSAVTPSTTVASFESGLVPINKTLPAAFSMYMSTSVTTTANTTALCVTASGADL